jgi:hypothetical protein
MVKIDATVEVSVGVFVNNWFSSAFSIISLLNSFSKHKFTSQCPQMMIIPFNRSRLLFTDGININIVIIVIFNALLGEVNITGV